VPENVTPTAADFEFHIGNDNKPGEWDEATQPSTVAFQRGAGISGSDRATLIWNAGEIRNTWLQVTVLPAGLGLNTGDVFYFGNAVAEAGESLERAQVTTADLLLARNNPRDQIIPVAIDCAYDYDRDGQVNATDVLLARNNQTSFLNALKLIDLTGDEPGAAAEPLLASGDNSPVSPEVDTNALFDELAWLDEYEDFRPQDQPSKKSTRAAEAVDLLLATYWE